MSIPDDGWEYEVKGKKYNKRATRIKRKHTQESFFAREEEWGKSFFNELRDFIKDIKRHFSEKGFDTESEPFVFRERYVVDHKSDKEKRKNLKKQGRLIEAESIDGWGVDIWEQAEFALNQTISTEFRMKAAFRVGMFWQLTKTYMEYGESKSMAAKKPRSQAVHGLIEKVSKTDESAKALWNRFFGLLDKEGFAPESCDNELAYNYTNPDNGKSKRIKFSTFQNKLSEYRRK